jgi:hypothetical protein
MTVATIRFDVARLLADANEHVREAEQLLAHGADRERVKAAGDLVALKRHKEALEARLDEIDHCPKGAVAGLLQRIREEGLMLRQSLEALVMH